MTTTTTTKIILSYQPQPPFIFALMTGDDVLGEWVLIAPHRYRKHLDHSNQVFASKCVICNLMNLCENNNSESNREWPAALATFVKCVFCTNWVRHRCAWSTKCVSEFSILIHLIRHTSENIYWKTYSIRTFECVKIGDVDHTHPCTLDVIQSIL